MTAKGLPLLYRPATRFLIVGGATFLVDIGLLDLLHGVLGLPLVPSTAAAFTCAFVVNFLGSRQWTFTSGRSGRGRQQVVRYLILAVCNLVAVTQLVAALSEAGINYLIAKTIATAVNALANFFAYRHWVFAPTPSPTRSSKTT